MSVRFDVNTDRLLRTSDLLDFNSAYTWMAWVYLSSDLNANSVFWSLNDNTANNRDNVWTNTDGTTLASRVVVGGVGTTVTGTNLSTATWYHVACVRESATSYKVYLNGALDSTNTRDISGRTTPTRMEHGCHLSANSSRYDGRVAAIKAWSTSLTLAEVLQERLIIRPARLANLYAYWPVLPGSGERTRDYSGAGRGWTEGGTLTDEDGPPISWGQTSYHLFVPAAGGVSVTPAEASAVGASVAPSVVLGSISITPAAGTAVGASVAPTVILGPISVAPSAAAAVGMSVAPSIVLGAISVTPGAASAVAASVAPSVGLSSVSVTPAPAEAVGASVAPTVSEGGISITPSPATTVGAGVAPTVILGPISISPSAAAAIGASVAPTVTTSAPITYPTGPTLATLASTGLTSATMSSTGLTSATLADGTTSATMASTGLTSVTMSSTGLTTATLAASSTSVTVA
jgi:hypothetical protein